MKVAITVAVPIVITILFQLRETSSIPKLQNNFPTALINVDAAKKAIIGIDISERIKNRE